jgi:alpha-1,2-glucosyltransferase
LRIVNAQALCVILTLSYGILRILRKRDNSDKSLHENEEKAGPNNPKEDSTNVIDAHSAVNIALFPPLFFFSALYYTDVWSTTAVLLAYFAYLANSKSTQTVMGYISAVFFGVIALLFRQTNILQDLLSLMHSREMRLRRFQTKQTPCRPSRPLGKTASFTTALFKMRSFKV